MPSRFKKKPSYNPITWEAKVDRSEFEASLIYKVSFPGTVWGLHWETLSWKSKTNQANKNPFQFLPVVQCLKHMNADHCLCLTTYKFFLKECAGQPQLATDVLWLCGGCCHFLWIKESAINLRQTYYIIDYLVCIFHFISYYFSNTLAFYYGNKVTFQCPLSLNFSDNLSWS